MLRPFLLMIIVVGSCAVVNAQDPRVWAAAAAYNAWRAYNSPAARQARELNRRLGAANRAREAMMAEGRWREREARVQAANEASQRYQAALRQSMYANGWLDRARAFNRSPREIQALSAAAEQARMNLARAELAAIITRNQAYGSRPIVGRNTPSNPTRNEWIGRPNGEYVGPGNPSRSQGQGRTDRDYGGRDSAADRARPSSERQAPETRSARDSQMDRMATRDPQAKDTRSLVDRMGMGRQPTIDKKDMDRFAGYGSKGLSDNFGRSSSQPKNR